MDKFSDDLQLVPLGTWKPTTVAALLHYLSLTDAPPETKTQAIADWLTRNEPGQLMQYSLRRHGYAHLLDQHQR